jgi:hypothetical protein
MTAIEKQTFPFYWNLGNGQFAVKTTAARDIAGWLWAIWTTTAAWTP